MIANNCRKIGLFCKSTVIKSGTGLWNSRKVRTKDLSECAVTIDANVLKVETISLINRIQLETLLISQNFVLPLAKLFHFRVQLKQICFFDGNCGNKI